MIGGEEYENAEMQLVVCKVVKIPPNTGRNNTDRPVGECAYVDGCQSDLYNSVHLNIKKMTAGQYVFFYTAKFRKEQLCRKLNLILHAPKELTLKRISAKDFGIPFLNDLERRNFLRQCEGDAYN